MTNIVFYTIIARLPQGWLVCAEVILCHVAVFPLRFMHMLSLASCFIYLRVFLSNPFLAPPIFCVCLFPLTILFDSAIRLWGVSWLPDGIALNIWARAILARNTLVEYICPVAPSASPLFVGGSGLSLYMVSRMEDFDRDRAVGDSFTDDGLCRPIFLRLLFIFVFFDVTHSSIFYIRQSFYSLFHVSILLEAPSLFWCTRYARLHSFTCL